jgi:hypothetical protein
VRKSKDKIPLAAAQSTQKPHKIVKITICTKIEGKRKKELFALSIALSVCLYRILKFQFQAHLRHLMLDTD